MKKSLRDFDPAVVARLELEMWKAYYSHKFFRLFYLLTRLLQETFQFGFCSAVNAAYHAAMAAAKFRLKKGKETPRDQQYILSHLNTLYLLVSQHSVENFDYREVAKRELRWWYVDRYPERYVISRTEAIADAAAALFAVTPLQLSEYAAFRAKGMELQDVSSAAGHVDWGAIHILLQQSYRSLSEVVR